MPDTVCKELLVSLSKRTFPDNKGDMLDMMEDHSQVRSGTAISPRWAEVTFSYTSFILINPGNLITQLEAYYNSYQDMTGSGLSLYRVLHLVGHIALCQLVHLDVSTLSELKRRAAVRERRDEV